MKEKLKLYIDSNLEKNRFTFRKARMAVEKECSCSEPILYDMGEAEICSNSLDEFIEKNKDDNKFQKLLFKYIDDRDLKDSDVYNKVHIDRRLFSKIRSDNTYHPSKETVILLALSLELNEDELLDLLASASYTLPKNNVYDLIIRFCFIEGIYDVMDVNDLLESYECKLLMY